MGNFTKSAVVHSEKNINVSFLTSTGEVRGKEMVISTWASDFSLFFLNVLVHGCFFAVEFIDQR